jgi:ABC-type dipeptide/oligopeptide/nickel transport system permease component/ABC-type transport system substrate-binding protein
MKARAWIYLLRAVGTVAGLTALLWMGGWALHPGQQTPPPRAAGEIARVEERRALRLDREAPPRVAQEVDYREGAAAAWWPRIDPPVIAEHVAAGRLPPVAERTGPEPIVMAGEEEGRHGGTLFRLIASERDMQQIYNRLSYANLVRWSPQGYPIVPHLAREWSVSPDHREYTFQLRRGMRWSDGHPVSADDIGYWYEHEVRYFEANPRVLRHGARLGRVEVVDELTVRFIFEEPHALFLEEVASLGLGGPGYHDYLTPAHYLRRYHPALGDPELIAREMRVRRMASPTALYGRLKEWNNPELPRLWPWVFRDRATAPPYVFVRNPYYPAVDPAGRQLPYLDRMVLTQRPVTLFALTAATGQVSMQDRFIRYDDHVLLMGEAARNGYEVLHWYPATRSVFTIFPVINRRVDPEDPVSAWKHALLNDRRFRQALSLAIDRPDIINVLFNGVGEPAQIDPGPDSPFHDPVLFKSFTSHDPARAHALLDELGLGRRDGEGYRTFPDGTRMVWYLNMTEFTGNDPAHFVVADWARVGIRVVPRIRARSLFYTEKAAYRHDFNVWTGESEFMPLVEPRSFVPTYGEAFYAPRFGIWYSLGGLDDPAAFAHRPGPVAPPEGHPLLESMRILRDLRRTTDEATRMAGWRRIQEINAEEVWHISLATPPPQLVVVKDGLRNVPTIALSGNTYNTPANAGMETWFWQQPHDPPATVAAVMRAMIEMPPPLPEDAIGNGVPPPAGSGRWLQALLLIGLVTGLVLVARRHPFIGRRLALMVPTLGVVSLLVFIIVQLPPGDYVTSRIMELEMEGTAASQRTIDELRRNFHLDESHAMRYLRWLGLRWFTSFDSADAGLLQGNLGLSMEHNRPVSSVVGDRILFSVVVSVCTLLFTWFLALPIGVFSAVRQYSLGDYLLTFVGFLGMSVPGFLLAVVLMWVANRWLGIQVSGLFSPEYATMPGWTWGKFVDLLKHLWVPVVVLGVGGTASMIRIMRANLLDELRKPYVTTARAKGVRPLKLLVKYPVRLALNPFVSGLGALFPQLISGAAIVALVLSLPMVGPLMLDALMAEDVYLAGSMLMVLSLLGVVGTLVSDLVLLWLDPRIRMEGGSR